VAGISDTTIGLALQGGGAFGIYQLGAYQALAEQGFEPGWFAGNSIGSVAVAILAGNPVGERVAQLEAFWASVTQVDLLSLLLGNRLPALQSQASIAESTAFGARNFFVPRPVFPLLSPPGITATSIYDTTPLKLTLERLVDFARLNRGSERVILGATDIAQGTLVVFDNAKTRITVETVLASGALPLSFPAVTIDGTAYWDGGVVANTPVDFLLDNLPAQRSLIFVVDLFQSAGPVPETFNDVLSREEQILNASKTAMAMEAMAAKLRLRHAQAQIARAAAPSAVEMVHVKYRSEAESSSFADLDFSNPTLKLRREQGFRDIQAALAAKPWDAPMGAEYFGVRVHQVMQGNVTTLAATAPVT
jgi:NTE family protein